MLLSACFLFNIIVCQQCSTPGCVENKRDSPEKIKNHIAAAAALDLFEAGDNIIQLNKTNFYEVVGQNKTVVVLFFGTWCGHCKQFYPTFAKVADIVAARDDLPVIFAQVSSTEVDLIEQIGIQGYPTVKMFPSGSRNARANFNGKRTVSDFLEWIMLNHFKPYVDTILELDDLNFSSIVNGSRAAVLYFGSPTCAPCHSFEQNFRDMIVFCEEEYPEKFNSTIFAKIDGDSSPGLKENFSVTAYPWLVVVPENCTNGTLRYDGERAPEMMGDWAMKNTKAAPVPQIVADVDGDTFLEMLGSHTNIVALFSQKWCVYCHAFAGVINQAAEMLLRDGVKDTIFLNVDVGSDDYLKQREKLKEYPTLKVFEKGNLIEGKSFTGKRNQASVSSFVLESIDAASKPYSLLLLNDSTFDEVVDGTRNVLVMFYADWCPHCKSLKPALTKLGSYYQNSSLTISSLIAAKAQSTDLEPTLFCAVNSEDSPSLRRRFDIKGYPTLLFFRRGFDKPSPPYTGRRGMEAIGNWVVANEMLSSRSPNVKPMRMKSTKVNEMATSRTDENQKIGSSSSFEDKDKDKDKNSKFLEKKTSIDEFLTELTKHLHLRVSALKNK